MSNAFDIIVIGGGHAGCEVSLDNRTTGEANITGLSEKEHIGRLSCNPAIGGLAKATWFVKLMHWVGSWQKSRTDHPFSFEDSILGKD